MKRILITGAESYIGTWVESYLSRWPDAYSVDVLDVRTDSWREADFHGYDVIFHVAAIVHQKKTKNDPAMAELYRRVNTLLPLEIAEKAKHEGVGQFVFMSTESVYGLTARVGETVTITKDTLLCPADYYGSSKLEAERGLQVMDTDEFRVAILRPPIIYGKGCRGNYVLLSRLARIAPFFPDVKNRRSMLYIENFAEFLRMVIDDRAQGVFCPQNREDVDVGKLSVLIAREHGKKLILVVGFNWALKLMGGAVGAVNKAFGSLVYDRSLSDYNRDYCVKTLEQSIAETER